MSATTPSQTPTPVADLSYEQARDELVSLVSRIESGQVPLEEAMVLWERGEALAKHCQDKLDAAQASLERTDDQSADGDDAADDTAGGDTGGDGDELEEAEEPPAGPTAG